ncbi:aldo-keto reductase family 1 member C4-like [Schistocerca americana]|uniref:aldo-keto reductase family 1 member C4-like n=1 Tax=Schistocerca americana TaxID=7009 RepID=UPI001F4FEEF6|nr:aldo-keto reductase family 1 member C4-like [Schistocerca americana]
MPSLAPTVKLNDGRSMPAFGLSTWQETPEQVREAVKHAIDVGYRHIDTAAAYHNESGVGDALQEKFKEGAVKREDVFVTSKTAPAVTTQVGNISPLPTCEAAAFKEEEQSSIAETPTPTPTGSSVQADSVETSPTGDPPSMAKRSTVVTAAAPHRMCLRSGKSSAANGDF